MESRTRRTRTSGVTPPTVVPMVEKPARRSGRRTTPSSEESLTPASSTSTRTRRPRASKASSAAAAAMPSASEDEFAPGATTDSFSASTNGKHPSHDSHEVEDDEPNFVPPSEDVSEAPSEVSDVSELSTIPPTERVAPGRSTTPLSPLKEVQELDDIPEYLQLPEDYEPFVAGPHLLRPRKGRMGPGGVWIYDDEEDVNEHRVEEPVAAPEPPLPVRRTPPRRVSNNNQNTATPTSAPSSSIVSHIAPSFLSIYAVFYPLWLAALVIGSIVAVCFQVHYQLCGAARRLFIEVTSATSTFNWNADPQQTSKKSPPKPTTIGTFLFVFLALVVLLAAVFAPPRVYVIRTEKTDVEVEQAILDEVTAQLASVEAKLSKPTRQALDSATNALEKSTQAYELASNAAKNSDAALKNSDSAVKNSDAALKRSEEAYKSSQESLAKSETSLKTSQETLLHSQQLATETSSRLSEVLNAALAAAKNAFDVAKEAQTLAQTAHELAQKQQSGQHTPSTTVPQENNKELAAALDAAKNQAKEAKDNAAEAIKLAKEAAQTASKALELASTPSSTSNPSVDSDYVRKMNLLLNQVQDKATAAQTAAEFAKTNAEQAKLTATEANNAANQAKNSYDTLKQTTENALQTAQAALEKAQSSSSSPTTSPAADTASLLTDAIFIEKVRELARSELSKTQQQSGTSQQPKDAKAIEELVQKYVKQFTGHVGKPDFALFRTGARIVPKYTGFAVEASWRATQPWYLSLFSWGSSAGARLTLQKPQIALDTSTTPGDCWAFPGARANLTVDTPCRLTPTAFTIDHLNQDEAIVGTAAPKSFTVYGMDARDESVHVPLIHGQYNIKDNAPEAQTFNVPSTTTYPQFSRFRLEIHDNHGHSYTCLYRFRIHGTPDQKCIKDSD